MMSIQFFLSWYFSVHMDIRFQVFRFLNQSHIKCMHHMYSQLLQQMYISRVECKRILPSSLFNSKQNTFASLFVHSKQGQSSNFVFLVFDFWHSFFSSPPQRPMTSDFEGFPIPDFIHYIYCPIFILEKEPVFPYFLMFSAKQGNYWYHFYNVFGMTRSLSGD